MAVLAEGSESRVRRATRAGGMLLEDLLEFLEKGLGEDLGKRALFDMLSHNYFYVLRFNK